MAGVLFIVIVPRAEYEKELRKKEIATKIVVEGGKYQNSSKVAQELKRKRKCGNIKDNIESYPQDVSNVILSKCKSTDCLHTTDKEISLQKSNSEYILGENEKPSLEEYRNYVKTSWDEIKQTIKPGKRKLKITSRQDESAVLASLHYETSLEMVTFHF